MTIPQHEAIVVVHAGLADVLRQLGEEPVTECQPRHAAKE